MTIAERLRPVSKTQSSKTPSQNLHILLILFLFQTRPTTISYCVWHALLIGNHRFHLDILTHGENTLKRVFTLSTSLTFDWPTFSSQIIIPLLFLYLLFYFSWLYWEEARRCHNTQVEVKEQFAGVSLLFHNGSYKDGIQVARLVSKCLYPQGKLAACILKGF